MPTQKTRQEIIDYLTQCGGLSYQNFVNFLYSIPFLNELGGGSFDSFISKFTGTWLQSEANKGKYDVDYYAVRNNNIYRSTVNNNLSVPGASPTWVLVGSGIGTSFLGVAYPATVPGVPTATVFYLASPGTYPNFLDVNGNPIVISAGSGGGLTILAVISYNLTGGYWEKIEIETDADNLKKLISLVETESKRFNYLLKGNTDPAFWDVSGSGSVVTYFDSSVFNTVPFPLFFKAIRVSQPVLHQNAFVTKRIPAVPTDRFVGGAWFYKPTLIPTHPTFSVYIQLDAVGIDPKFVEFNAGELTKGNTKTNDEWLFTIEENETDWVYISAKNINDMDPATTGLYISFYQDGGTVGAPYPVDLYVYNTTLLKGASNIDPFAVYDNGAFAYAEATKNTADIATTNAFIETFRVAPKGVQKLGVHILGNPSEGEYLNLRFQRVAGSMRITSHDTMVVLLTSSAGGDHYVKLNPFDITLGDGEFLYLNKVNSATVDPVQMDELSDVAVYPKKSNWFNVDNQRIPIILCVWYTLKLECFVDTFSKAYDWNRTYADKLSIYGDNPGAVTVLKNNDNTFTVTVNSPLPAIFDKQPRNYFLIQPGTVNLNPGDYLVLSSSNSTVVRPEPGQAPATSVYIKVISFTAIDASYDHIILAFAGNGGYFASRHLVFNYNAPVTATVASQWNGKKITVEGDSIMEQGFVTSDIANRTGAIMDVKAVSGSGYVQNVSGTIRSRVNAITASNPAGIILAGGTNDFGNNIPLGSYLVTNDDTQFYSAVYNTLRILKEDNPTVPILVVTPIVRNYVGNEPRGFVNSLGFSLRAYCEILIACAKEFSIQVCDLNQVSGITYENIFDVAPDGVHVQTAGGKMMGGKIVADLETLAIV